MNSKNKYNNHVFSDYNTFQKRKNKITQLLNNKIKFNNKMFLIGFGAIGKVLLYFILNFINIDSTNITIIDEKDFITDLTKISKLKFNLYNKTELSQFNYKTIFKHLSFNDIIIDCSVGVNSLDIIKLCNQVGASYINSAITNVWTYTNPDLNNNINTNTNTNNNTNNNKSHKINIDSLYHVHKEFELYNNSNTKNYNAIICMGCNPGNVSLWSKIGLLKIAQNYKSNNININNINNINDVNLLAHKLGVQVIHISEKDTQIVNNPKKINEYCNTWSGTAFSYYDEGLGYSEISLGTHEKDITNYKYKNDEYVIFNKGGIYTYAQSWIPFFKKFIGNILCHDESYTIGKALSVYDNNSNKLIYKPSVYYVYNPSNETKNSISELKERDEEYQTNCRLLTSEIIDGADILGLTFFLENKDIFWIGSTLDIHETRKLFNNEINEFINATILQVVAGYFSGIVHLINLNTKNIKLGIIEPDDLPFHKLIKYQLPFLGDFLFVKHNNYDITINNGNYDSFLESTDDWQFNNFIINN